MGGNERRFTIGRDRTCDVPIADDSVSRLHAQLSILEGDQLFLVDCQSSNGTTLIRNGETRPVRQEFLTVSDDVRFGSVTLSVEDILAVIRQKHRIPRSEQFPQPKAESRGDEGSMKGKRLVRCSCGSIKAKGERCRTCGI
jgi:pSer/pThr/pTyr-binding forkhead associated (FHA) protein